MLFRKNKQKIKVFELSGVKLDPDAIYLIACDVVAMPPEAAQNLGKHLMNLGIISLIVYTHGRPDDCLKVYSIPKQDIAYAHRSHRS